MGLFLELERLILKLSGRWYAWSWEILDGLLATQNKDYISHSPLQLDVFMWLSFDQCKCFVATSRNIFKNSLYASFPFSNPFSIQLLGKWCLRNRMCRLDLENKGHILVTAQQKAGRNLVFRGFHEKEKPHQFQIA